MRRIFLLALVACMLLVTAVAQAAAQITDVKWGVDKNNVLRLVVDITETAGYAVELNGSALKLTVNAGAAGQVPKSKKIKSSLADELRIVEHSSYTEVYLPLKRAITGNDYKAFTLKKDNQTGRPFRVVMDVTADKRDAATTTAAAGSSSVISNKPVVGNRPVKTNAAEAQKPTASTKPSADSASKPASSTKPSADSASKPASSTKPSADSAGKPASSTKPSADSASKPASSTKPKADSASKPASSTKPKADSASKPASSTKPSAGTTSTKKELPAIKSTKPYRTSGGIKGKVVTIDPGHGGSDPGAIGASGLKEKQITLEISMRVKELLESAGAKVYMTRTTDVDVCGPNASDRDELQARVNVAEKHESDLFVSLHINSSVNKNVGGFSSYYYPKTDNDLRIAKNIQNKLAANFGVDNLGVRQANFYVIKRTSMPATLVEMCFISNAREEALMKGKWFQKKTARLIVEGISQYFG